MKQKKIELDVDFIGGQGALTVEEEKSLSVFFKHRKMTSKSLKTKFPQGLKGTVKQP